MKTNGTALKIFVALTLAVFLTACPRKGPFERAGERVDEVSENVSEGDSIFHKEGPGERLGESVDDLTDSDND